MIKHLLCLAIVFCALNFSAQTDTSRFRVSDTTHLSDDHSDTARTTFNIPIFSTGGGDVDADLEQQDVSSLLSSSRDVFLQFSSFQFGASRYRPRGLMADNQIIMINGVNVNNVETGFSSWSNWGGLNDVTRYVETRFGNVSSRYAFSGAGGYINIDSKASSFKKGTRISYANANRIFGHRVMATHSTGMMLNGWALTVSASSRQGNQVYIPGTYFNANAYYISIDKRLDDRHLLSFTGFGAPIEQGRSTANTLEAYEIAGSNYYNSVWGYQNGKVRNASVSTTHRPMLMLSHIFNVTEDSRLTSSVFYNFGKSGLTGINWNNAPNPRPDYYRYFPSYYYDLGDNVNGDILTNNWANNTNNTQQIKWDDLIRMNKANLYSDPGQVNTTESRARYILEDRVENLKHFGFNTVYNTRIGKSFLSAGLNGNIYRNRKYREMEDLLGATFWIDIDQFAENLGVDPLISQNDIENPNRKIFKGDRFGYDYSININKVEAWIQNEYNFRHLDLYFGLSVSSSQIYREGFMANGKFPTTSKGKSETLNFFNSGVKAGATYKIDGRNFITVNGTYLTRNPEGNNIFISPRVRNDIVSGIRSEEVRGADINYLIKHPNFKARITAYYTQINNQTWVRTFWHDAYNNNVNMIMKGVNQVHQGIEIGLEKKIFTAHVLQFAFGYGEFVYTNRPTLEAWQDNNATAVFKDRTVYLKNYKVGGSPQMVTGMGYTYNAKRFWFAGFNFNHIDHIYIEPNPDRRTAEAAGKFQVNETEQAREIIGQERLPSYFTLNANGGKSWRIMKKYYLRLNLSINNILNNRTIRTSGFEQLRWDTSNIGQFDNKYFFMTGTTYMAIVNFNF